MSIISITFILVSTIAMTLNTIPSIAGVDENGNIKDSEELAMVESVCITWFTIEYILRLAGMDTYCNFFLIILVQHQLHFFKTFYKIDRLSLTHDPYLFSLG